MGQLASWASSSCLHWLSSILFERFGVHFILSFDRGFVEITLAQQRGVIQIRVSPSFSKREIDGCASWCAVQQGWKTALEGCLPAPGVSALPADLIQQTDTGFKIEYDLLGLTYWMLARCEEVCHEQGDRYDRFPSKASHAYRHGYLQRPIVDEWLFILRQVIERQWPDLVLRPMGYSMRVSHDVDEPSRYAFKSLRRLVRVVAIDMIRYRDWLAPLRALYVKFMGRRRLASADPANTFDWLMRLSERHHLTSAFYFICGRTHPTMDADYEPEAPAIRRLMQEIHSRGHEIGLHPSFETFARPELIAFEAQRLRDICAQEGIAQSVWGGRMHYLRWSHPLTMNAWEQADMTYDSTLGYADLPGFRCGTCHEYPAFDPVRSRQLKLRIRPLVAMEVTVMSSTYMGLGCGTEAVAQFDALIRACRAVGGCFTLLWHNSNLSSPAERALYERVIELGAVKVNA